MLNLARKHVIANFPMKGTRLARVDLDEFAVSGVVKTRLWGEYDFSGGNIWFSELNPSVHRYFHSWLFMSGWITWARSDKKALRIVTDLAKTWLELFSDIDESHSSYRNAYHDEGTAQRARVAIRLHYALSVSGSEDSDIKSLLERMLLNTARLLRSDGFYSGLNNHGMLQSLALRDLSSYAEWFSHEERLSLLNLANARLAKYFETSYTSEGVHIEHSPSYHLMVLRDLSEHVSFLRRIDAAGIDRLEEVLKRGTDHTIHSILPSGVFLPLSDTQQSALRGNNHNVTNSPYFTYAATMGERGLEPKSRTLVEPKSGYFIHRSAWGRKDARYLAFIAAYNASYHKHSDDLHVYLWDSGHELLSESGPFGYNSKDPFVKYGFSQWAHNNVIVDNNSLPRNDGKFNSVGMDEAIHRAGTWAVKAHNNRHEDVKHVRTLEVDDSVSNIRVIDQLDSQNEHSYTLNWNVGPTVDIELLGNTVIGRTEGHIAFVLSVYSSQEISVNHYHGRGGKRPLGWRFPRMNSKVPASLLSFTVTGRKARLTTTMEVLKPAGLTNAKPLVSSRVESTTSDTTEDSIRIEAPFSPRLVKNKLTVENRDPRFTHAVVKLFKGEREHSRLSGHMDTLVWTDLTPGLYRMRIFPKHTTLKCDPYTTDWFRIR